MKVFIDFQAVVDLVADITEIIFCRCKVYEWYFTCGYECKKERERERLDFNIGVCDST